jgi:hypothetical protein
VPTCTEQNEGLHSVPMNWLIARRVVIVRGLAWFGILAISILSVVPNTLRPVSGAGHRFEHFAAFALVAGTFAIGYRLPLRRLEAVGTIQLRPLGRTLGAASHAVGDIQPMRDVRKRSRIFPSNKVAGMARHQPACGRLRELQGRSLDPLNERVGRWRHQETIRSTRGTPSKVSRACGIEEWDLWQRARSSSQLQSA